MAKSDCEFYVILNNINFNQFLHVTINKMLKTAHNTLNISGFFLFAKFSKRSRVYDLLTACALCNCT